jgi:hypothetical protein
MKRESQSDQNKKLRKLIDMEKNNPQQEKGICPCTARNDTSVAVSNQDKTYLETLKDKRKDGSVKQTLAFVIEQHRTGASA